MSWACVYSWEPVGDSGFGHHWHFTTMVLLVPFGPEIEMCNTGCLHIQIWLQGYFISAGCSASSWWLWMTRHCCPRKAVICIKHSKQLLNHRVDRMKCRRYQRANTMSMYIELVQFLIHMIYIFCKSNSIYEHIIMNTVMILIIMTIVKIDDNYDNDNNNTYITT